MAVSNMIRRVKQAYFRFTRDAATRRSEAAVYAILSQGAAAADTMTPVDTSTLINSRYSPQITLSRNGVKGHVGYTAQYAPAVHDAPGKFVGQSKPRSSRDPSRGDLWDPNAEPEFLTKGFEQIDEGIQAILRREYGV